MILKKNPDSISFLIGKNQQVCKILEEAAFYNDNVLLNINNIKDFEECVKFINKLGYEGNFKQMDSVKFFKSLQREVKKNKDIILFIKKYINDYEELKNLFETKFDKSASSNYIINAISNESKFILKNEKGHFFNGIYKIKAEKYGEMKQIKIAKLKELRERALLTNTLYNVPEEIENQKTFKEFIEKVNTICKIYDLIKEIYSSGYFKEIKIVIENKYNKTYYTIWNTVTSYPEEVFNKIENELNDFSKKKKAAYRDIPLIRYIYGRQLKLIYDKIYEKKNNDIYPLLIFISNNSGINKYNIEYNIDEEKDIFFNINNYINEIFRTNRKNLDNIMSLDTLQKKDGESEFCGIYTFQADRINNTLQKNIVLIYKYLTDKKPKAQYILLCNEETSIEEITSFLYRAILCHFKSCFIIAGIEFLKLNQRMAFQILLDELYKKNEERMKSCLIIAYEDNDADIIKGLFSLKNRKSLRNAIKKIENQNIYNFDSKVEIVFSDNVGVGKSAYIRSEIEEKRKREYIYFPFGGELTKEEILKRLKELKKMKNLNRASLHLDLYDTDQIELTNEFLFSILINKIYGQNDDIFYLPSDFEIMVEIPNGNADFMKKFPILEIFKKTFLGIENLLPLKVKSVLDTNVQIVANYLKFLKNDINCLNTRDIYFEGINPNFKEFETKIVAEILPQKECQELILKKIEEKIPKPNYYQITSFINILGTQLRKFSQNFILSAMNLNNSGQNDIRSFVVKNFIEFAIDLESGYIDLIKNQMRNYRKFIRNFNEDKKYEEAILKLANVDEKKNIISFDNMKRTLLIFSEGNGEGFSIISNLKDKEEINKYSSVMAIGGSSKIPMLNNNVNQKIFLEQLKVILNVNNKIGSYDDYDYDEEQKSKNMIEKRESQLNKKKEKENKDEDEEEESEESKEEELENQEIIEKEKTLYQIKGNYIFTADNYLKMALILLRIRANIPVIIMGGEGCGKTSLIMKLSEMLNNGDKNRMKILNINGGTRESDIIRFLEKKIIPQAKHLEKQENRKTRELRANGFIYYAKKLWVLLDGINTCKSLDLISEMMCKHTYQGKLLPSNIVFIGVYNTYRYNTKNIKPLKYNINPLPLSLLNFVFDFGNLTLQDEKYYIAYIIKDIMEKYFDEYKENNNSSEGDFKKIYNLAKDMIVASHEFIRKENDKTSVSLSDIKRFKIFYEFFFNYLKKKKDIDYYNIEYKEQIFEDNPNYYSKLKFKDIQIYSIILSIFVCYYLCIPENKKREEFKDILNKILNKDFKEYGDFLEFPKKEQKFIVKNMELERGIIRDQALLDNLFALFACINSKVPLFIIGKPGCGKSLSVQLINKTMKGNSSNNPIFKNLPRIIMSSLQGSIGSTSQEVKNVFKKARQILQDFKQKEDIKNKQEIISMVFFDGMELAECSQNMPLKLMHSELEYDLNEEEDKKIAFVGLSNWSLDVFKMNNGVYLSIPDLDENDIKKSAITIAKTYDKELAKKYIFLYESLGMLYYKYKTYLNLNLSNGFEEFHGNRDFYYLIKNVSDNIIKENKLSLDDEKKITFVKESIERNFAGLMLENPRESSLRIIKRLYRDINDRIEVEEQYDILQRISQNLEDLNSRYLLIISKPSINEFLMTTILKEKGKEYNYYKGSPFKNDLKSEEYILKIMNKIHLNIEQDKVIILSNLGTLYPSLYDLFDRNFIKLGNNNYTKIAFGYTKYVFTLVNDKFRCIINFDEKEIGNQEAPFLNRFEKHILSFDYLLNKTEIDVSNDIYEKLTNLIQFNNENKSFTAFNYNLKDIFINLDKEEIKAYLYKLKRENIKNLQEKVIEKLSLLIPQDIILFLKYSGYESKFPRYSRQILEGYEKGEHTNLSLFLKKMNKLKNVVYTFSDVWTEIQIYNITNDLLGEIKPENISDIRIGSFISESKFEDKLDEFFNNKNKKLCLIRFNYDERYFLNYIKLFIENKEKDNKISDANYKKAFIFIVCVERNFKDYDEINIPNVENEEMNKFKETISLTSEFYQIFIDDLNEIEEYTLKDFFNLKGKELFKKYIYYQQRLENDIYETFSCMDYNLVYSYKEINRNNYIKELINYLKDNKDLQEKINDIIMSQMEKDENIISNAFKDKYLVNRYDINIISSIRRYLNTAYTRIWNNFYYKAEKDQFFSTLLSLPKQRKKNMIIIEDDYEEEERINKMEDEIKKNVINISKDLYLDQFSFEDEIHVKNYKEEKNKKANKIFKFIDNLEANPINIILGLQLPGIYPVISNILNKIHSEIYKEYALNESKLRSYIQDERNETTKYKLKLKTLNDRIKIDLEKDEKLNKIPKKLMEKIEFDDCFLEDYYTIFIYNNLGNYIRNLEKNNNKDIFDLNNLKIMLKFIVEQRNKILEINTIDMESIAGIINWIECYSVEITYILKIYLNLSNYMKDINRVIEHFVYNDLLQYERSDRCKDYTSIVNKAIFLGFESLLKIITSKKELYLGLIGKNNFSIFLEMCKEILNQVRIFDINLKLYSKELLSLQEILEIIDCLNTNKKCTKKIWKKF